jgi:hypothetical protein
MSLMHSLIRFASVSLFLLFCLQPMAQAQPGNSVKIDIKRQLFHEYIDREQKNALKADGKADNFFKAGNDEDVNFLVTQALTKKVDALQLKIEKDTALVHNTKVTYLRGVEMMLKNFTGKLRSRKINPSLWPQILDAYEQAMILDIKKESIEPLITKNNYDVGYLVLTQYDGNKCVFDKNRGYSRSRQLLLLKFLNAHPDEILPQLKNNFDVPFRDSLIIVAAYKNPMKLYDYASATNQLGIAIRSVNDPLVKTISKMATSDGSGQMYFPFLDNIIDGKTAITEIEAVKNDNVRYYKLLVKTRVDYINRGLEKKTLFGMGALEDRLREKARNVFIKEINGLHEEPDAVRFRILQQLNAQELYYLIVFSDDELYTSSYTKGVYPAVMAKSGNRGDSLLMMVGFDRFKKFIKMAAGYNTLNEFLKSFPSDDLAKSLMQGFVNNLERSVGLEDGVDVADSYTSIMEHNKPLAEYVLNLTKINLDKNQAANNHRGIVIYNLLYKLFLSADTTNKIDLSKEFGIPPVYDVKYNTLADSKGRVAMHVFFYGDKDGKTNYQNFMPQFQNANWKITHTPQWVAIASTKGKPFTIYANKPLPEETNQDSEAQKALEEYLDKNEISPSIVIHRGHSYYAETTISYIKPTAKVVYLGSCGGYHLLHEVLKHSDDAHIIASKQIGKGVINEPFMRLLIEKIRNGNDLEWIPFWNEFKRVAGSVEGFDDYIPPHKNLGAIFIKAYKSQMGSEESDQM